MSSIYPISKPTAQNIDQMTGMGGNYWQLDGLTSIGDENIIGIFKSNENGVDKWYFWHEFYTYQATYLNIDSNVINIQYQMGDSDSDWQGLYLNGSHSINFTIPSGSQPQSPDLALSLRGMSNQAWYPSTGIYTWPTDVSCFQGYFSPYYKRFTIWREIEHNEGDSADGSTQEFKTGKILRIKIQRPSDSQILDSTVVLAIGNMNFALSFYALALALTHQLF